MKPCLLLLCFCLLGPRSLALAPHPSVLLVKYKDQMLPVVRVHGDDPFVIVDGKETVIRSEPVYLLESADGYSNNFIESPRGLGGIFHMELIGENTYDSSALHSGQIDIPMTLKARKTIKGGFVAAVMFSSINRGEVIVHELPDLPAGEAVKVNISVHALPRTTEPLFFAQIFDEKGREVLSPDMSYAWSYYAARDRLRLAAQIKKYREKYPRADHPAEPVFTSSPVFKPYSHPPTGEITVMLTVGEDGTVTNVDAGMIADDRARDSVIEALSGWLFLPRLKAGEPVFTTISVPLQF